MADLSSKSESNVANAVRDAARRDELLRASLESAMPRLTHFARRLAGSSSDGDDIVQDTLARAWRYRANWDEHREAGPWLLRTAFRVALDHRRKRQQRREDPDEVGLQSLETRSRSDRIENAEEVARLLRALKPIERTLLVALHRDGLSIDELSVRHSMPANTVKSHLHRARLKLRALRESS